MYSIICNNKLECVTVKDYIFHNEYKKYNNNKCDLINFYMKKYFEERRYTVECIEEKIKIKKI